MIYTLFVTEHTTDTYALLFKISNEFLHQSSSSSQESSLVVADGFTNLWVDRHRFRGKLDTLFMKIIILGSPGGHMSFPIMGYWPHF